MRKKRTEMGSIMGKVLLNWTYQSDLIECPDYISDHLLNYQLSFDQWLTNPSNHHGYWTKDCEGDDAVCFGSDAFVDWLNEYVIKDGENKVIFAKMDFQANEIEKLLPHINF